MRFRDIKWMCQDHGAMRHWRWYANPVKSDFKTWQNIHCFQFKISVYIIRGLHQKCYTEKQTTNMGTFQIIWIVVLLSVTAMGVQWLYFCCLRTYVSRMKAIYDIMPSVQICFVTQIEKWVWRTDLSLIGLTVVKACMLNSKEDIFTLIKRYFCMFKIATGH